MNKIIKLGQFLIFPSLFFATLFLSKTLYSMEINEAKLKELLEKNPPPLMQKIEAQKIGEDVKFTSLYEMYGPSLFYQDQYANKAFRNRAGLSSIYDGAQTYHIIGVKEKLPLGTELELNVKQNTTRTNFSGLIPGAGTQKEVNNSLELKGQFDIWKNFLGRIDQAKLRSSEKGQKIGELKKKVESNRFKINLRRLYWRLVANQRATDISQKLLKSAEINANNVKAKRDASLADAGDVARANASVSARKGSLLSLDFEKENLVLNLKNLMPILSDEEVKLTDINVDEYINEVMLCIGAISNNKEAPLSLTYFKAISDLLAEQLEDELTVENSHDKMNLQLVGSVYRDGESNDSNGATKDFKKKDRTDYAVGLMLEIPLGSRKELTRENKVQLKNLTFKSESMEFENQMKTTHSFISNSIQILVNAMKEQRQAKAELDVRLESMRKKYRQGRISISELVIDEDQLLNAELSIVQTQLLIVETLLNYFEVFDQLDCPFNKF